MKNLSLISFVGVDEQTNWDDLVNIKSSVASEFSVLFSDSKSVQKYARYPSYQYCKDFVNWAFKNNVCASVHLCGSVINRYLDKESDVVELCKNANRIQLNLNIDKYSDYLDLTGKIFSVSKRYGHSLILQQNKTKEKFMQVFLENNIFPISILHDSSGGFGREITEVISPDKDVFTGYAGGINPENVVKIVDLIEQNNPDDIKYYIDMESGIRENNIFSPSKCQQIIDNLKV